MPTVECVGRREDWLLLDPRAMREWAMAPVTLSGCPGAEITCVGAGPGRAGRKEVGGQQDPRYPLRRRRLDPPVRPLRPVGRAGGDDVGVRLCHGGTMQGGRLDRPPLQAAVAER